MSHPVEAEGGDGVLLLVYDAHGAVQVGVAALVRRPGPRLAGAFARRERRRAPLREHGADEQLLGDKVSNNVSYAL